jgi:hypothetical protein
MTSISTTNQLGVILECILCDDFFVTVSREFNQPEDLIEVQQAQQKAYLTSSGKGKKKKRNARKAGIEALAQVLVSEELKWHHRTFTGRRGLSRLVSTSRCPSCIERVYQMEYQDWLENRTLPPIFSLCIPVVFDDEDEVEEEQNKGTEAGAATKYKSQELNSGPMPPIYLNRKATGKPKWTLVQGIGPPSLEVDRSRSNRIWRPSLSQFGLCGKEQPINHTSLVDNTEGYLYGQAYADVVNEARSVADTLEIFGILETRCVASSYNTDTTKNEVVESKDGNVISSDSTTTMDGMQLLDNIFGLCSTDDTGGSNGNVKKDAMHAREITKEGANMLSCLIRNKPLGISGTWKRVNNEKTKTSE